MTFPAFLRVGSSIFGILRNFRSHAAEMKSPVPSKPIFFLKPASSCAVSGVDAHIFVPSGIPSVHHEVELGVIIGKAGKRIPASRALEHIAGYVGSLDVTCRQWQAEAKENGLPWTLAKGADTFCGLSGTVIPSTAIQDPSQFRMWVRVNGELRQDAQANDMVFGIPELVAAVSQHITLMEGDLILTGTPAGVGPLVAGDTLEGGVELGPHSSTFSFSVMQEM